MQLRTTVSRLAVMSMFAWILIHLGARLSSPPTGHAAGLTGIDGQGRSTVLVQNLDLSAGAQFVPDLFGRRESGFGPRTLPAGGAIAFSVPVPELPAGAYAAITSSDQAISTVVRTEWARSGGAVMSNECLPGTDVIVPFAAKGYNGHTSIISIQNTLKSTQATATLDLNVAGRTTPLASATVTISPGASSTVDLGKAPEFATVPAGTAGYVRARSTSPIAVLSVVDIENSRKGVYAFEGLPVEMASAQIFAPLIHAGVPIGPGAGGTLLSTFMSVVNPGATLVDVDIKYVGVEGSCKGWTMDHPRFTLAGQSGLLVAQAPGQGATLPTGPSPLPYGCTAAATVEVTGGSALAAVVDIQGAGQTAMAYSALAPSQGATTVLLPLIRRRFSDLNLTTAIQVMNLADQPAAVSIRFRDGQGELVEGCTGCAVTLPAGGGHLWWPADIPELGDNLSGSAVVTSDQPVGVVVNDISAMRAMDMASYVGIGVPTDLSSRNGGRSYSPLVMAGIDLEPATLAWRSLMPGLVQGP